MKLTAFITTFGVLQSMLVVLRSPQSQRALTSLAEDPAGLPLWIKLTAALVQLVVGSFHLYGQWIIATSLVCYGFDMITTMELLHKKSYEKGNAMEFARQQRALAVLQASFTQLYATWNMLMEAMCVGMAVLNLYLAVELRSVRALILAVGVGASYCFGMKELGQVYETSRGILTAWKSSHKFESNRWFRKFMRSCRPNFVPLGTFFYVDGKFVLTVVGIIINGAASLILAN